MITLSDDDAAKIAGESSQTAEDYLRASMDLILTTESEIKMSSTITLATAHPTVAFTLTPQSETYSSAICQICAITKRYENNHDFLSQQLN